MQERQATQATQVVAAGAVMAGAVDQEDREEMEAQEGAKEGLDLQHHHHQLSVGALGVEAAEVREPLMMALKAEM